LFNLLREGGGHLLLTGRSPPARWPLALADLRSRLAALPVVALAPPDDAGLAAVIVKLFADRQLRVEPDVVRFLVERLDRSFAAAAAAVAALDRAALAHGRAVTVPLVRAVLPSTIE
jgi:chromosomal replication initiation ATPase DnaA